MKKTKRNIVIVALFAIGGGWLGVWVNNITGQPQSLESLGALIWLITPAFVGLLLRAIGRDGWKDAGLGLYFRTGWKWYLTAILVYPLIAIISFALALILGGISVEGLMMKGFGAYAAAASIGIVGSFMKNIFEEFAWRGYLTPRLEAVKIHPLLNHLIVGIIWWAWHLPYYFFLFDRVQLEQYLPVNLNTFVIIAFFLLYPTAILFGELRLLSKSVWPVFVLHSIINGLSMPLILSGFIEFDGLKGVMFSPTNDGILTSTLFGVVGLLLYRYRMTKSKSD